MANITFNRQGFRDLLRSPGVMADLERRAQAIAAAADTAGGTHVVRSELGPERARAAVVTADFEAMRLEATRANLTGAIDAGR